MRLVDTQRREVTLDDGRVLLATPTAGLVALGALAGWRGGFIVGHGMDVSVLERANLEDVEARPLVQIDVGDHDRVGVLRLQRPDAAVEQLHGAGLLGRRRRVKTGEPG